jgi:hypothetical protein
MKKPTLRTAFFPVIRTMGGVFESEIFFSGNNFHGIIPPRVPRIASQNAPTSLSASTKDSPLFDRFDRVFAASGVEFAMPVTRGLRPKRMVGRKVTLVEANGRYNETHGKLTILFS